MKPSRFNFWSEAPGHRHLLLNGITGALYELSPTEKIEALRILSFPDDAHRARGLGRALVSGGFLVPREVDEVALLVERNRALCELPPCCRPQIAPFL